MANKNLTIFQRLGQILGPDGVKQKQKQPQQTQRYNIGNGELLKTDNKSEFDKAKLQAQQNKYLGQVWKKVENGLFQQSINYETTRIGSYADFEAMEFYPTIAAALDVMMEECLGGETIIPLLNGSKITIEELYNNNTSNFWVYAIDINSNKIKPSKVEKVILKGVKDTFKMTLDDDSEIICTDNHKWLLSNNKWVETKDLKFGDSLKSISSRLDYKGYEKISLTNFNGGSKLTHVMVGENELFDDKKTLLLNDRSKTEKIVIHHKSFNKLNNEPSQLEYMFWDDHKKLHTDLNKERWENIDFANKMKKIFSENGKKNWVNCNKELRIKKLQDGLKNKTSKLTKKEKKEFYIHNCGKNNPMYGIKRVGEDNPNYDNQKNHIKDIIENDYINFVITSKGNKRKLIMDKFNLNKNIVINYNKLLCEKYSLSRIEDFDFMFNDGFNINTIKDFISTQDNPKRTLKKYCDKYKIKQFKLTAFLNKKGYKNWSDIIDTIGNHRVIKIEYLGENKVYDLLNSSVDSNFAVKCNTGMIISHNCTTLNDHGRMLNVYSDSKRVKGILEDLFFNRLDLHTSLPMFTRNTCKFGDNFVYLNIDDKHGIIGAKQMPNYEMERREAGLFDMISGRETVNSEQATSSSDKVKFFWRGRDVEFNSWQIAHFRLLGDDRRLPYGTSVLEKSRRVWKQLLLSEDSMLVYRVTRAPERRVYKIYVGNIDDADVEAYVNTIADRFKRMPIVDPQTGQMDLRFNQLPVWKKTPIPLLDGRTISIEELAKEYSEGKENWVYSVQDSTSKIVAGKVKWCGMNYTANEMIKVTLDDNTYIVTAREHPFILRDGSKKRADELETNDSLMPFYKDEKTFSNKTYASKYETLYNPNSGKFEFTHRLVGKEIKKENESYTTIHHKNFNSKDNTPPNLQWVDYKEHIGFHSELSKKSWADGKHGKTIEKLVEYNKSEKKELRSKGMRIKFDDFVWSSIRTNILSNNIINRKTLIEHLNTNNIVNHIISINKNNRLINKRIIQRTVVERLLKDKGFGTITEYIKENKKNHKVKSIDLVDGDDVYCMTVVGPNDENDRHNFAALSFKNDNEISVSGSFLANSNDQDYFIPVRTEDAPNPIDTLPGACISLDTRIPLLDGRVLELNEIISEWDNGNRNLWVYSCDPKNGSLAPGLITWAGETRKDAEVIKITLDNGKEIITTPDHKWVHRTNGFVEAKDLVIGDSLMPFYTDLEYIMPNKKYAKKYKRVWDSNKKEWIFTHRMVNDFMKSKNKETYFIFDGDFDKNKMKTTHHIDNDRFNNNPDNLTLMDSKDHYLYHRYELWSTPEKAENTKQKISSGLNSFISSLTEKEKKERAFISMNNSKKSRVKANTTFSNNPNKEDIIKLRGESISKAKSSGKFKEKFSEIAKNNWLDNNYKEKVFSKKQTITFTNELYNMFFELFKLYGKADLTLIELNKSEDFMNEFLSSNKDIRSSLTNLTEFTHNHLIKMIKQHGYKNYNEWCKHIAIDLGYKNVRAWRYYIEKNKELVEANYNHKIVLIEYLTDKINTGTITVDGDELYHNYHTFAIESGVFIKNSNLDQIADIEYLQRNLFTSLRVPKPFLGFEDATGEGKNLALQDIRFSRTINRIQQSMLQELNKIAIIHLYILGFEEDLDNFTLTLNNPSTQAEMLKVEHTQLKITLFKDAVSDAGNGFGAMSMTRAHREILGWSDDEIKQDLLEQRMEKAAAAELLNTAGVIKHTGMFDVVDRIYGDYKKALEGGGPPAGEGEGSEAEGGGGLGGSFGGGGAGGEDLDFGETGEEIEGGKEAEAGAEVGAAEVGGEEAAKAGEAEEAAAETVAETINKAEKLLNEQKIVLANKLDVRAKKYKGRFVDILMESIKPSNKINEDKVKIYDKNIKINNDVNNIINDIDKMLDE